MIRRFGLLASLLTLPLAVMAQSTPDILIMGGGKSIFIPGFRTYYASGYLPSSKNVELLNGLKPGMTVPRRITFDVTTNNSNSLWCRGSYPVYYGQDKTPFAALMEAAINLELAQVGLSHPDAPPLQASLDQFDFSSSAFTGGKWMLDVTMGDEGKMPVAIKTVHEFPVAHSAAQGCGQVRNALSPAIESLLFQLYSKAEFQALFR